MYVCIYVCMYVCIHVCMYVYIHICIDTCIHIAKHMRPQSQDETMPGWPGRRGGELIQDQTMMLPHVIIILYV